MVKEIKPEETSRESAFYLWMKAPNPMVTLFKKINVTNLVKVSKKRRLKFNMLMDYCIGKTNNNDTDMNKPDLSFLPGNEPKKTA